ncbi:hypothetical protein EZI45_10210 [Delftia tsuruhatensis]|uniref:hypothetical protein n=1 Tax=Delftia tsuruhatensis TaxID=180282 RepID=UPI0010557EE4|nr:hypothetical protein [Delftia tsuruhatensis]TDF29908.1 hypothetical protein EZI45_10210 [Delftia tsuruhatensis]
MRFLLPCLMAALLLTACETAPPRRAVLALDETSANPELASAVVVSRVHILSAREDGNISFAYRGNAARPDFSWGAPTDFGDGKRLFLPFTRAGELVAYEVLPGWICADEIRFGQYYPSPPMRSARIGDLGKEDCVRLQAGEVTYIGDFLIQRTGGSGFGYSTVLTARGEAEVHSMMRTHLADWPVVSKRIDKNRPQDSRPEPFDAR